MGLRGARRGRGSVGLSSLPVPRRAARTRVNGQPLARNRIPPGGRDAPRGGSRARLHRDRGVPERGRGALPAPAHPRLERRGAPARDRGPEPAALPARLRPPARLGPPLGSLAWPPNGITTPVPARQAAPP